MGDCRTCKHNPYLGQDTEFVDCVHPITIRKNPRWEPGDPEMVNFRTADVSIKEIERLADCPVYEAAP